MTEALLAWFKLDPGTGAFYALFGFLFVFIGIVLLVLFFTVFGLVMKKLGERKKEDVRESVVIAPPQEEGISPELVAVITAALAAYYEEAPQKCDFIVRRIKRL